MTDKNELTYGQFIKNRRKELGISQAKLAEELQCSVQAISKYENNTVSIYLSSISVICKVLKLDLTSFFNKVSDQNNNYCDEYIFDGKKFASSLIYLREKEMISQKQLAEKLGIGPQKITKWETEKSTPSIEEFISLCNYFNLSFEELYFSNLKEKNDALNSLNNPHIKRRINPFFIAITSILLAITTATSIIFGVAYKNAINNNDITHDKLVFEVTYLYEEINKKETTYVEKNALAVPPEFKHKGYNLINYTYKGNEFNFEAPIVSDLLLKANLEKKKFDVRFYGLNDVLLSHQTVPYKESAVEPEIPDYEGHTFVGWNTTFDNIESNLDVKAIFTDESITAHLIASETKGAKFFDGSNKKIINNYTPDKLSILPIPELDGYIFKYRMLNGEIFDEASALSKDIYLYPDFIKDEKHKIAIENLPNEIKYTPRSFSYNQKVTEEDLPLFNLENQSVMYYMCEGKRVDIPFVFKYDHPVSFTPVWSNPKFEYKILANGLAKITKVNNLCEVLTIPSTIDGIQVIEIGSNLFNENDIVKVLKISKPVSKFHKNAINDCKALKKVIFNNDENTIFEEGVISNCDQVDSISICCNNFLMHDFMTLGNLGLNPKNKYHIEYNKYNQNYFTLMGVPEIEIESADFSESNYNTLQLEHLNLGNNLKEIILPKKVLYITWSSKFDKIDMDELVIPSSVVCFEGTMNCKIKKLSFLDGPHSTDTELQIGLNNINSNPIDVIHFSTNRKLAIQDGTNILFKNRVYLPNRISKYFIDDQGFNKYLPCDESTNFLSLSGNECDVIFKNSYDLPDDYKTFNFIKHPTNANIKYHFKKNA